MNTSTTHADDFSSWSWTQAPTVFESLPTNDISDSNICPTIYQFHKVTGEKDYQQVCLSNADGVRFGKYISGSSFPSVVGFPYDSTLYPLSEDPCQRYDSCLYLPDTDTLVTKQYLINPYTRSLVLYKNFSQRLIRSIDPSNLTAYYTFDSSNPDYTFKSSLNYAWPIGGFGASNNGKWLAIEFRQRGIGLLNIETLEMRRLSTQSFSYGSGRDPTAELAVTNDGEHLIVTGKNAGLVSYDVAPNCGEIPADESMGPILNSGHPCKISYMNTGPMIDRFYYGTHPVFSDDGGEMRFYVTSFTDGPHETILRAAGYGAQRLDYLALGDSFTSGEGETDDSYYQPGTNDEFEKCHLSTRSYPYLIAQSLGIDGQNVRSVACSGATMGDVAGGDKDYWGQGTRLGENRLSLSSTIKNIYQATARDSFIPGRVHQLSFVEYYKPKVITIGIGGNDVGFMEKLKSCIGIDTCEWADTPEGREKTALEVQNSFDNLVSTYSALYGASPDSKIYAIGYPKVIDSSGHCNLVNGVLLSPTEQAFMNEGIRYINQVIATAAKKAGIKYVDIQESLGNRILCGSQQPSAMNGITLGDDGPISNRLSWLKIIGNESFHPRPTGHENIASAIKQSVPNVTTYSYCQTELSQDKYVCPIASTKTPNPSAYWLPDGKTHNYELQRLAEFSSDTPDATDGRQKIVSLGNYAFAPGSSVRAEIHSSPVVLGTTTANSMGALSFNIELPAGLIEGYHTLHLYGTSYSGQKVDLYQVIKYLLPVVPPVELQETVPEPPSDQPDDIPTSDTDTSTTTIRSGNRPTRITSDSQPVDNTNTTVVPQTSTRTSQPSSTQSGSQELASNNTPIPSATVLPTLPGSLPDNSVFGFLIPSAGLLFLGSGFALYARLRRNR